MQFTIQHVLSFLNDPLLLLGHHLLLEYLLLELLQSLDLVVPLCESLNRVLILLLEEGLQLISRHLSALQLVDLRLRQVNDLIAKCIAKHLIINIVRPK